MSQIVPYGYSTTTNKFVAYETGDTLAPVDNIAGQPNGLATLDGSGKLPSAQIPASLLGGINYQGTWNASANTPTLSNGGGGSGSKGYYYVVDVAGSTSLDGHTDWHIGDWVISNGVIWDHVDNTEVVSSVAGKIGAVTLVAADITDFTSAVNANTNVAATISHIANLNNPHSVTAAQVGNTTAQWNANLIQGATVDANALGDKKVLVYHTTGTKLEYVDPYAEYPKFKYLELMGGRSGNQNNGYLQSQAGGMFFNVSQYIVPFNATIIKITAACESAVNEWRAEVRSNLNATPITSLVVLSSETSKVSGDLAVNVSSGDKLSLYLQKGPSADGTGTNIPNPNVVVIMERR